MEDGNLNILLDTTDRFTYQEAHAGTNINQLFASSPDVIL